MARTCRWEWRRPLHPGTLADRLLVGRHAQPERQRPGKGRLRTAVRVVMTIEDPGGMTEAIHGIDKLMPK
nr:hypothetical protein [Gammaproteobacteria bacterium]